MAVKKALILAGGLGTRLRPLTIHTPKCLIKINGITLIEHVINKLREAGVERIYLSIGYLSDKIRSYCEKIDNIKLGYLVEKEPLGTGGCMHLLNQKEFKEDFIVVNGDDLFDLDWNKIEAIHKKNHALITIALKEMEDISTFGVIDLRGERIVRFVEKPSLQEVPSHLINSGYYMFSPEIFKFLPRQEKFSLEKDLFPIIASKGKMFGYVDPAMWFDVGTFERLEEVRNKWKK